MNNNIEEKEKITHIGQLIAKYRKNKKISQTELSKRTGISQSYIGDLESLRSRNAFPSLDKIILMGEILTDSQEEKENFILKSLSLWLPINIVDKINKCTDMEGKTVVKIKGFIKNDESNFYKTATDEVVINNKENLKNIFGIKIEDKSLEPEILENSLVIINPEENNWDLIKNKIAMVSYRDKLYIRQVNLYNNGTLIQLKAINSSYEDIMFSSEEIGNFKIYGKVIKAITEKNF